MRAHGTAVGLPSDADMGNSEVGHNALGSGQVVDQVRGPSLAVPPCSTSEVGHNALGSRQVADQVRSPTGGPTLERSSAVRTLDDAQGIEL